MGKVIKVTERHMLTLLSLAIPKGLTKNEIIQMCKEKFGISITDSLVYNILERLMNASDKTGNNDIKKPFVRRKEVFKDHLSRMRHFKYVITLEGLEKLTSIEESLGKMPCRSARGCATKTRGAVSVSSFLSMPLPTNNHSMEIDD